MIKLSLKLLFILFLFTSVTFSQSLNKNDNCSINENEQSTITSHSIIINGKVIPYEATAGTMFIYNNKQKPIGSFFYIYYTQSDIVDKTKRPITFAYNGGPGSPAIWVHMGAFGPKRVVTGDTGQPIGPPYQLVDNQYSLLDLTDLVFIDPIGTGYSHALGCEDPKQFWGYANDLKSISEFIRRFVTENKRWNSPKYLLGESYGTMRSAGLANYLQNNESMYINGIIFISTVLNYKNISFDENNDLPYILFLPTYVSTALYHHRIVNPYDSLDTLLKEVRKFSMNEYANALFKGVLLSDSEREMIISKLYDYTGINKDFIRKANIRIKDYEFRKELLNDYGLITGRYDTRVLGYAKDLTSPYPNGDPSSWATDGAFKALYMSYLANDLGFIDSKPYITGGGVEWNFPENEYLDYAPELSSAMITNLLLKSFFANGYYDLATPFFSTEYTVAHLNLPKSVLSRITFKYYPAGHMMYTNLDSLKQLKTDLIQFYGK
jgi:carboxypeptidase C (cathepsin A)